METNRSIQIMGQSLNQIRRHHNGQKRTNNGLQNTTHKDLATRTPQKRRVNSRAPEG